MVMTQYKLNSPTKIAPPARVHLYGARNGRGTGITLNSARTVAGQAPRSAKPAGSYRTGRHRRSGRRPRQAQWGTDVL